MKNFSLNDLPDIRKKVREFYKAAAVKRIQMLNGYIEKAKSETLRKTAISAQEGIANMVAGLQKLDERIQSELDAAKNNEDKAKALAKKMLEHREQLMARGFSALVGEATENPLHTKQARDDLARLIQTQSLVFEIIVWASACEAAASEDDIEMRTFLKGIREELLDEVFAEVIPVLGTFVKLFHMAFDVFDAPNERAKMADDAFLDMEQLTRRCEEWLTAFNQAMKQDLWVAPI